MCACMNMCVPTSYAHRLNESLVPREAEMIEKCISRKKSKVNDGEHLAFMKL